jgi:uncharacterized protein YwgA
MERYRWLAAVIAAHPRRQVYGRTRLQKTVRLLQSLGLPTNYSYKNYFYGPYSEALQGEIGLLEQFGLVNEDAQSAQDGSVYYLLRATEDAAAEEIEGFQSFIELFSGADLVVLELAATYLSFREMGSNHEQAEEALRLKKGRKCDGGNQEAALELLRQIGLLPE